MRDMVDSDITFYLYASIDFIEGALKETEGKAKILIHCYKVRKSIIPLIYSISLLSVKYIFG